MSFAQSEYAGKNKVTRRDRFPRKTLATLSKQVLVQAQRADAVEHVGLRVEECDFHVAEAALFRDMKQQADAGAIHEQNLSRVNGDSVSFVIGFF